MRFVAKEDGRRHMAVIAVCAFLFAGCVTQPQRNEADYKDDGPLPAPELAIVITEDAQNRARALALFARGHIHEINRQPDLAISVYRKALQYDPESDQLHLRLALALIRANQFEGAAEVFQSFADLRPDQAQPLLWQGAMYRQRNQLDEAEALYREAIQRQPEHPQSYIYLYELLLQRGKLEPAVELLEIAVTAVEEPSPFYQFLGDLRLQQSLLPEEEADRDTLQQEAITAWERARELTPDQAMIWSKLGAIYLQQQDIDRAREYLEEAIRLDSTLLEAKDSLVAVYRLTGQLQEATALLESIALQQPNNARAFLALAELYEQLGDSANALRNYRAASRVGRPSTATFLKLAVLQMDDDPEQAIADLREGLSLIPGDPRLLELLGMLTFYQKEYASAVMILSEAERFWNSTERQGEPFMSHAPVFLALSLYYTGRLDEAASRLIQAMESSSIALETFVYFVVQHDDPERAASVAEFIEPLLEDRPDHIPGMIALGYLNSFSKNHVAARDALQRAYDLAHTQENPGEWLDARFFFWYAASHERLGEHERAEELFYRSLELDPEGAETYNYLAYMWAEQDRNLETAEKYVLIALEARPDSAAFIDTLGWIYYRQGRYEEAYREIRRAADILPDDPVITDHLGDIYLALGNVEQAVIHWRMALDLDPEEPDEIREKLALHAPAPETDDPTGETADESEPILEPEPDSEDLDTLDPDAAPDAAEADEMTDPDHEELGQY